MRRSFLVLLCLSFFAIVSFAQKSTITGTIKDANNKELLIGATIFVNQSGAITDFDGRYELSLDNGSYTLAVSYVGYEAKDITINLTGDLELNIELESSILLNEIVVTADIALERETPVAFTNIPTRKLEEELAAQDIPMILNSTPGAYATQSGGGDGDARITIRGFNQRNVAVMLDGIPVNDMENGWVYWSNWFGLDLVTQTMQVQRGLGASKLSVPSVGGTINILTKGIDAKRSFKFKQEVGNNGYFRSTLGLTTGRLKNGWGISAAGSFKKGDGWVKGNFTKGYFYYLRVDKQMGNHLISLSGFGAPQEHGQRPYTAEIALVDADYANELGVPESAIMQMSVRDKGLRFSEHWGTIDGELVNTRKNFYHKPQISLRHSWQANEKLYWSNVAYLSIGSGGGTAPEGVQSFIRTADGQYNLDSTMVLNQKTNFAKPDDRSEYILRASNNDHFWYGILSTLRFNINERMTLSGGIDARYYRGDHYRSVYDLLGGSYFRSSGNSQIDQLNTKLGVGDKFSYNYSGFVRQGGVFGLLEYKKDRISAFFNASTAVTGYSIEDFMKPKVVSLADTSFLVAYDQEVEHNGTTYDLNSPEAQNQTVDWVQIPSFTFKAGASFNLNVNHGLFVNAGYLSKAQRFNNVINNNRSGTEVLKFQNYDNENIVALELGYSYKSSKFSSNLNGYYTSWINKPLDSPPTVSEDPSDPDADRFPVNIPGIDALHVGVELDFAYKPLENLTIEGLASVGNWIWNSGETVTVTLPNDLIYEYTFDAAGVHVGDAAQLQFGGLVRYEPFKNLYVKAKATYFAKNFANFQPETLKGEDAQRESWQLPNYALMSFHAGYYFKINGIGFNVRANVLNLLNTTYISDARNNDNFNSPSFSDFDAKSASVHFGQGRRGSLSLQLSF
jgi:hypothetical protein